MKSKNNSLWQVFFYLSFLQRCSFELPASRLNGFLLRLSYRTRSVNTRAGQQLSSPCGSVADPTGLLMHVCARINQRIHAHTLYKHRADAHTHAHAGLTQVRAHSETLGAILAGP